MLTTIHIEDGAITSAVHQNRSSNETDATALGLLKRDTDTFRHENWASACVVTIAITKDILVEDRNGRFKTLRFWDQSHSAEFDAAFGIVETVTRGYRH